MVHIMRRSANCPTSAIVNSFLASERKALGAVISLILITSILKQEKINYSQIEEHT